MSVYFYPYIVPWNAYQKAADHMDDHDEFLRQFVCMSSFFGLNSLKESSMIQDCWEEGVEASGVDIPEVGVFIDKVFWSWTGGEQTLDIELQVGELQIEFVMNPSSVSNLVKPIRISYSSEIQNIFSACNDPLESGCRYAHIMEWIKLFRIAHYNNMGIANYLG